MNEARRIMRDAALGWRKLPWREHRSRKEALDRAIYWRMKSWEPTCPPHGGLTVTEWHDDFASIPGVGIVRYRDLKCIGCGMTWKRVAPTIHRSTSLCDECAALNTACDQAAQKFWDGLCTKSRADEAFRMPHYRHPNGNTGVYGLRDILFDHVRGAKEIHQWDARRLAQLGFNLPKFGSRKI